MYVELSGFGALRRTPPDPELRSVPGFGSLFRSKVVRAGGVSASPFGSLFRSKVVNGLLYPTAVALSDPQQAAVGAFVDESGRPFCTGALIRPHIVLSAAHCGVNVGDRFVIGPDAASPAAFAFVAAVARDARWSGTAYDHLLVRLDRDLEVAPLPLASAAPAAGTIAQGVGYGMVDPEVSDNTKRWWTAEPISAVSDRWIAIDGEGQRGLCLGDSGGPLIVPTEIGPAIIGTVSQGDATCTGEDLYSRPDPGWISRTIEAWKTPGRTPMRAWVPTAVTILGVGIAVGFLVAALRR
jgi:hypothetical protein